MNSGRVLAPTLDFQRSWGRPPGRPAGGRGHPLGAGDLIALSAVLGVLISWASYEEKVVAVREDAALAERRRPSRPARHPPARPVSDPPPADLTGGSATGGTRTPPPTTTPPTTAGPPPRRRCGPPGTPPCTGCSRPACRVLDVGAGTGFLSLAAAEAGPPGHRPRPVRRDAGAPAGARRPRRPGGRGGRGGRRGAAGRAVRRRDRAAPAVDAARPGCRARRLAGVAPRGPGAVRGAVGRRPTRSSSCAGRPGRAAAAARGPDHHHDHYDPSVLEELPLAGGTHPDQLVELVEAAGWGRPGWSGCATSSGPSCWRSPGARLLGVTPGSRWSPADLTRPADHKEATPWPPT